MQISDLLSLWFQSRRWQQHRLAKLTSHDEGCCHHQYGGQRFLKYEDVPQPEPKQNELLISVIAAGVNPVDGVIRSGMFDKEGHRAFPIILGGDISGVVEQGWK